MHTLRSTATKTKTNDSRSKSRSNANARGHYAHNPANLDNIDSWHPKKPLYVLDLIRIPFKAFSMNFELDATSSLYPSALTISNNLIYIPFISYELLLATNWCFTEISTSENLFINSIINFIFNGIFDGSGMKLRISLTKRNKKGDDIRDKISGIVLANGH